MLVNPLTAQPGSLDGLPYFATFAQNITYYWSDSAPAFLPAFRHTWSVAIEEQFYLFWPALLWLVGRKGIPFVTVGLIGLAVTTRSLEFNRWILATHCDGLARIAPGLLVRLPCSGRIGPSQIAPFCCPWG